MAALAEAGPWLRQPLTSRLSGLRLFLFSCSVLVKAQQIIGPRSGSAALLRSDTKRGATRRFQGYATAAFRARANAPDAQGRWRPACNANPRPACGKQRDSPLLE